MRIKINAGKGEGSNLDKIANEYISAPQVLALDLAKVSRPSLDRSSSDREPSEIRD